MDALSTACNAMQVQRQAVDPNLVRLAEAYSVAAEQMINTDDADE